MYLDERPQAKPIASMGISHYAGSKLMYTPADINGYAAENMGISQMSSASIGISQMSSASLTERCHLRSAGLFGPVQPSLYPALPK